MTEAKGICTNTEPLPSSCPLSPLGIGSITWVAQREGPREWLSLAPDVTQELAPL